MSNLRPMYDLYAASNRMPKAMTPDPLSTLAEATVQKCRQLWETAVGHSDDPEMACRTCIEAALRRMQAVCTCQEPWTLGVVHRANNQPCYWPPRPDRTAPAGQEKLVKAVERVLEICSKPGMKDPFDNSWKWFYGLQEAIRAGGAG